jgi:hypothetical protein
MARENGTERLKYRAPYSVPRKRMVRSGLKKAASPKPALAALARTTLTPGKPGWRYGPSGTRLQGTASPGTPGLSGLEGAAYGCQAPPLSPRLHMPRRPMHAASPHLAR